MAVYTRTSGSLPPSNSGSLPQVQSNNPPAIKESQPLESRELGQILIRSLETVAEALDGGDVPVDAKAIEGAVTKGINKSSIAKKGGVGNGGGQFQNNGQADKAAADYWRQKQYLEWKKEQERQKKLDEAERKKREEHWAKRVDEAFSGLNAFSHNPLKGVSDLIDKGVKGFFKGLGNTMNKTLPEIGNDVKTKVGQVLAPAKVIGKGLVNVTTAGIAVGSLVKDKLGAKKQVQESKGNSTEEIVQTIEQDKEQMSQNQRDTLGLPSPEQNKETLALLSPEQIDNKETLGLPSPEQIDNKETLKSSPEQNNKEETSTSSPEQNNKEEVLTSSPELKEPEPKESGIISDIGESVGNVAEGVGEGTGNVAEGVGEGIGNIAEGISEGIGDVIQDTLIGAGAGVHALVTGEANISKSEGKKEDELQSLIEDDEQDDKTQKETSEGIGELVKTTDAIKQGAELKFGLILASLGIVAIAIPQLVTPLLKFTNNLPYRLDEMKNEVKGLFGGPNSIAKQMERSIKASLAKLSNSSNPILASIGNSFAYGANEELLAKREKAKTKAFSAVTELGFSDDVARSVIKDGGTSTYSIKDYVNDSGFDLDEAFKNKSDKKEYNKKFKNKPLAEWDNSDLMWFKTRLPPDKYAEIEKAYNAGVALAELKNVNFEVENNKDQLIDYDKQDEQAKKDQADYVNELNANDYIQRYESGKMSATDLKTEKKILANPKFVQYIQDKGDANFIAGLAEETKMEKQIEHGMNAKAAMKNTLGDLGRDLTGIDNSWSSNNTKNESIEGLIRVAVDNPNEIARGAL